MSSYLESTARDRVQAVLDTGSFIEFLPPEKRVVSPHLPQLDAPVSFDDGVVAGEGLLNGQRVCIAAQEGGFMGGAVGEVHGAKLVGMLQRAIDQRVAAVLLLVETGGVRLHEANAGLIAVSEVMRAVMETRAAGIPVITLVGGANGCFGGMGIVACCTNAVIISEEGRLAMSGPEVIETAGGVEEFDARDRALVWRVTGGKHRYLMGDAQTIVADEVAAFRQAAIDVLHNLKPESVPLTLAAVEAEQALLERRLNQYGAADDSLRIWSALGVAKPEQVPLLDIETFRALAAQHREGGRA